MRKPRKHYTPVEKVAILRRHLLDRGARLRPLRRVPGLAHPLLRLAEAVLRERRLRLRAQAPARPRWRRTCGPSPRCVTRLQRKDEVLAELMAEHVALKKELGEL